jgi:deoxyribose-phosphate aldolase
MITRQDMAKYIEHTQLRSVATFKDIEKLCQEAVEYSFYAVCVNSCYVKHAAEMLRGTDVKVVAAVGFPLGAMMPVVKAFEAAEVVRAGAQEVDMVINIGFLKSGDYLKVCDDIKVVVQTVKKIDPHTKVKVILEMCYLNSKEKIKACELAKSAGADFVKTSTGFGPDGAMEEDVVLMSKLVGHSMGIKAAGGIKDAEKAITMIESGVARIGTSSGISIVQGLK